MVNILQIAITEFEKKLDINWQMYDTNISERNGIYTIYFHVKDASTGLRGSPAGTPGFEIRIDSKTREIINSQFIR